ncbi:sensor histidine kinase [Saccharothrix violaceirubra]|uniref:histidine kinase n=1 Tax=Saccharothrix violaceirubra TaxID=413306 RepID=A0A7W7WY64_9PSEU|nr:sensor histidine kinase [Saccharothrix violaceirubra]MBB4968105.1 signal transduction histidine kinase [Saccharothrix violaceirubra]
MGRWVRTVVGLLLGFGTALPGLVAAASPRAATRMVVLERRRLARFLGVESGEPGPGRAARYLLVHAAVGLLGGFVVVWLCYGLYYVPVVAYRLLSGEVDPLELVWTGFVGLVLLYIESQGIAGVARLDAAAARRLLGRGEAEVLRERVGELAASRAGIVAAVDAERRRIERDLHDGVQQRLVALGMLLGRARRHPERADELVAQAHEEAREVLDDLRAVAWRVFPAALDALGLAEALATVADRSAIPVELSCPPTATITPVETAVYFLVSEAVTNAVKHSGATMIKVDVTREDDVVRVLVEDDGIGGADPAGGGLSGLSRRVLALDGTFGVTSPEGGPTAVVAAIPCA